MKWILSWLLWPVQVVRWWWHNSGEAGRILPVNREEPARTPLVKYRLVSGDTVIFEKYITSHGGDEYFKLPPGLNTDDMYIQIITMWRYR